MMFDALFPSLRRRAVVAAFATCALLAAPAAHAAIHTDIWFNPNGRGCGVNAVQYRAFMFLTFFIYDQDRKPTWCTGQLQQTAEGVFAGTLFLTSGTYYALPWNPADSAPGARQVGTVTFTPSSANAYEATLT